ncbi:MAG: glycosyl hydrolase [Phycisphaerales bacterium]
MTRHTASTATLLPLRPPARTLALVIVCCASLAATARAVDSVKLRNSFAEPPRQFASAPLWVWNDLLTEQQIVDTLRDLAGQKVRQVFVHPRPGLMTPYLSDDWFKLWKIALREAERLDMNVWIYDENSYPSGFAGGFVPDAMPESRGMGLGIGEQEAPIKIDQDCVAVFRPAGDGYENITAQAKAGQQLAPGKYLVASLRWAGTSGWYGDKFYVNLLTKGVTDKFLAITMDAYTRNIGDQFGQRVPGVFTDEPHLSPAGGLPWADDLPEVFSKRWGYDLIDNLPSLVRPVGDFRRIRHNYLQVLLDLFIERWAKPYYEYCDKHGIEFTGHYWEHEWPNCLMSPDNMAMYAWHQRPSIDVLMNQYNEDVHAQFGNIRVVRELASAANQFGRARTLCEAYGAGGWDLRFEDMKRIGDWLYVLGVNTMDEHLSYITIRGARKRDHPQSFSYHEPWWRDYHVMAEYFTRLSMILSQGRQVNRVLVLEPTTTAWMYQGDSTQAAQVGAVGNSFQQMLVALDRAQVEYDIGCEDIMANHGAVDGSRLKVGQCSYDVVVLPPLTENLNQQTMDLLAKYLDAGGKVLCCGDAPSRVDGSASDRGAAAAKLPGWKRIEAAEVPQALADEVEDGFAIERSEDDKGILFHHRRVVDDGEFLFLVNTSLSAPSAGTIRSKARSAAQWDLHTAKIATYPCEKADAGVTAGFELPPCGSLLLFLSNRPRPAERRPDRKTTVIEAKDDLFIAPLEENVLTLDYVDVTAGGETKKGVYFYKASQFAFAQNGMPRNPWDSCVQFKDGLITKTFGPDSGVEATYRFTIEGSVPAQLSIVVERPDLYTITCNGRPVSARAGSWWLDKSFGKIDLAGAAQIGENAVTIQAAPFTIYHELEPAYLLGSFMLKPAPSGFIIVGESRPTVTLGSWKAQGRPFYAAGVSYSRNFEIARPVGQYVVELDKWYGSVAEVLVNGMPAGCIVSAPWQCDVTKTLQRGTNTIDVRVIGTLKNTLGPHHAGTSLGSAWPGMFQQGPEAGPPAGDSYHTVDYGLFTPFVLKQIAGE